MTVGNERLSFCMRKWTTNDNYKLRICLLATLYKQELRDYQLNFALTRDKQGHQNLKHPKLETDVVE